MNVFKGWYNFLDQLQKILDSDANLNMSNLRRLDLGGRMMFREGKG
jgi:hypothetical protein